MWHFCFSVPPYFLVDFTQLQKVIDFDLKTIWGWSKRVWKAEEAKLEKERKAKEIKIKAEERKQAIKEKKAMEHESKYSENNEKDSFDASLLQKIKKLKRLYKSGTLTKVEFEKAKNKLLK